jgi:hypothetical protein
MSDELNHILNSIDNSKIIEYPFYHLYIENIFSDEFYAQLKEKCNNPERIETRKQDNKNFINSRFSIYNSNDECLKKLKNIFESKEIKLSLFSKFFEYPDDVIKNVSIHKAEFEFVYTPENKFQNIHTDIPSKFLSLVFYFPDDSINLSEQDELDNGTILYDKTLTPVKSARYKKNSVCVFAPSLHSYHGFHTTIKRTALVMFYINNDLHLRYEKNMNTILKTVLQSKENRFRMFKFNILNKLQSYPLIEYKLLSLDEEFKNCKINEENGRIIL